MFRWDAFANEFFEDEAQLTLTFCLEDGPKRYSEQDDDGDDFDGDDDDGNDDDDDDDDDADDDEAESSKPRRAWTPIRI